MVDKKAQSSGKVQEYQRRCNECKKLWHSLVSREQQVAKDIKLSSLVQASTACGGNMGAATQSQRNVQSQQDLLDKLKRCPNCGSKNYSEKIVAYEKKD